MCQEEIREEEGECFREGRGKRKDSVREGEVKKDSMSGKDKGRGRRVCQGEIREEEGEYVREG